MGCHQRDPAKAPGQRGRGGARFSASASDTKQCSAPHRSPATSDRSLPAVCQSAPHLRAHQKSTTFPSACHCSSGPFLLRMPTEPFILTRSIRNSQRCTSDSGSTGRRGQGDFELACRRFRPRSRSGQLPLSSPSPRSRLLRLPARRLAPIAETIMTAINQTDCAPFSPILTAVTFSLFGFIIGIWADGFEKLQLVPLLIVTPLTFLGGSFYSISMLPPVWRTITLANPIVYLVSGFRWSFYGSSDVSVTIVGCCTDRFTGAFPPALLISRSKREVHSGSALSEAFRQGGERLPSDQRVFHRRARAVDCLPRPDQCWPEALVGPRSAPLNLSSPASKAALGR